MPRVRFTNSLSRLFPNLDTVHVNATNVADLVRQVDAIYPRLASYVVDERGTLRRHVNIYVGDYPVRDRAALQDCYDITLRHGLDLGESWEPVGNYFLPVYSLRFV